ncbi:MAG: hypothetical protein MRY63_07910 [Neomegalonema sp.]|nr:hypothetical protein [Neomegalonema sp.]
MRHRLIALVSLTAMMGAGAQASAEPIAVRGGEHGAYSRVALDFAPERGWTQAPTEGGMVLTFNAPGLVFNTKAMIRRQAAHRLKSAQTLWEDGQTKLILGFNCECNGTAYRFGKNRLLIDIRDGAPEKAAPVELAEDLSTGDAAAEVMSAQEPTQEGAAHQGQEHAQNHTEAKDLAKDMAKAKAQDHAEDHANDHAAEQPKKHEAAHQGAADHAAAKPEPKEKEQASDAAALKALHAQAAKDGEKSEVALARDLLLRQLQRAADEGFISFVEGGEAETAIEKLEPLAEDEVQPVEMHAEAHEPSHAPDQHAQDQHAADQHQQGAGDHGETKHAQDDHAQDEHAQDKHGQDKNAQDKHGDAHKAIETAARAHADPAPDHGNNHAAPEASTDHDPAEEHAAAEPSVCESDGSLMLDEWGGAKTFNEDLAELRRTLYTEEGVVDRHSLERLTELYLFNGLGPEASHMPDAYGVSTPRTRALQDMADVVTGKPVEEGSIFLAAEPCPGLHGLWQAAALADRSAPAAMDAWRASNNALIALTAPLRRIVGARIATAAIAAEQFVEAQAIMDILERNGDEPTLPMFMVEAELALSEGYLSKARYYFDLVMKTQDPLAPRAAIRYSETLQAPAEMEEALMMAARLSSYALQYRHSPVGDAALEAEARLLARFGKLEKAFVALDYAAGLAPEKAAQYRRMRHQIFRDVMRERLFSFKPEQAPALVETLAMAEAIPEFDDLRTSLAQKLINADLSALVEIVLPDAVAQRSSRAADLRVQATSALALGGDRMPIQTADAPGEGGIDYETARMQAFSAYIAGETVLPQPVRAALEADRSERAQAVLSLFPLPLSEDLPGQKQPIADARMKLEKVQQEIDFLKEIATDG